MAPETQNREWYASEAGHETWSSHDQRNGAITPPHVLDENQGCCWVFLAKQEVDLSIVMKL